VNLAPSLAFVRDRGAKRPAIATWTATSGVLQSPPAATNILLHGPQPLDRASDLAAAGWALTPFSKAPDDVDAMVAIDTPNFGAIMRAAEPLSHRDVLVVPAEPAAIVDDALRHYDAMQTAWNTTADANYVARCALRGHYLEFGTWYGRSFFSNYYRYRHWLRGRFYAFDSFAGLSAPLQLESEFTGGDFYAGGYCCNVRSFEAIRDLVDAPRKRIHVVPGFYSDTLRRTARDYDLDERSVSVCVIDCDLREPTEEVLRFVTPLLEPGALLYFDDWRLTRASSVVGERAAALAWLKEHPDFELVELHREMWQHQWFIFQRSGA
jgi:hypothetical protein